MLKALKWAYTLGVRQERIRIAAHLTNQQGSRQMAEARHLEQARNETKQSKKDRAMWNAAVDAEIQHLIREILEPNSGEWNPGKSIMFPDDKHKGDF